MSLQTFPITLVYCFCFHKLPGFCNHIKVIDALMWQLNRRLRLCSTFFNILSYLKGGETFAFCSVWSWCYDWRRQGISIYRSEQDSNGKEIRFPVLNAEHFAECLCPVGRPDCSPKPLPSFPHQNFWSGRRRWHSCPHYALYPVVLQFADGLRNSHFLMSPPRTVKLWKNIWSLNCCWDHAILNLFCPLLFFVSH